MSDAPRQPNSPSQEFYDLSILYVEKFGVQRNDGLWTARLERLSFERVGSSLLVQYLRPCAAQFEIVWSNASGFNSDNGDWYQHLDKLRRVLILDRIADV